MTDVVLVTGRVMPVPDRETSLLEQALRARGAQVEIIPWDADIDWAAVSLVVVRSPWDYFGRRAEFLRWARTVESVTTLTNPADVLVWNSHKAYLVDLSAAGVPVVPTVLIGRDASPRERSASLAASAGDVIIKPAVSGGAVGVLRTPAGSPKAAEHLASLSAEGEVLIQPYVPAVAGEGEASLIYFGGTFSHAVRKVPAAGEFRVQHEYGGTVTSHTATARERDIAEAAISVAPGSVSYARVDLVHLDAPMVMELEVIEPELFLPLAPQAAARFAGVLAELLESARAPS